MKFFCIEPEAMGQVGEQTIFDHSTHPPLFVRAHFEFDIFPEDQVIGHPFGLCLVVPALAQRLTSAGMTGFEIEEATTNPSSIMTQYDSRETPRYVWLRSKGVPGRDDFAVQAGRIIVSDRFLALLNETKPKNLEVEAINATISGIRVTEM